MKGVISRSYFNTKQRQLQILSGLLELKEMVSLLLKLVSQLRNNTLGISFKMC